jgi:hypothetical protein
MKTRLLQNPGGNMAAKVIQAGFDFLQTIGDAVFTFPTAFAIPENFFHDGSQRFAGTIPFVGYPIREFTHPHSKKKYKSGAADTVIHRTQDVTITSVPGSGTTKIELVHLLLKSRSPIEVPAPRGGVHLWDVQVSLSPSKASTGTMTITQTSANGGHFASALDVWPVLRFERQFDGVVRHLDMGSLPIPNEKKELVTRLNNLQASDVAWDDSPLVDEEGADIAVLTGNFRIPQPIVHTGPHPVVKQVGLPQ